MGWRSLVGERTYMQVDEDIAINESLEAVAFDDRERLADVVDACDSQSTERDRFCTHWLASPFTHLFEATTQRFID